jgi:diadenosine tetraphosphate (Ap4A) HIT family hydrolase
VISDDLDPECVFCRRINRDQFDYEYHASVVRFPPLGPVVPGHMLFVPIWHVEHPSQEAVRVAMGYAEKYAQSVGSDFNLITSSGPAATQTIPHIHVHYVPRHLGDGLALPWTGQRSPK